MRQALLWLGLACALGVPNLMIAQKESLRANGTPVLLELGTRDPRSLMQGDYMQLRYMIAGNILGEERRGKAVIRLDERGVAQFVRLHRGEPLAPGELLLAYHRRDYQVLLGAEDFFFEEGQAEHFAAARYGLLRVSPSGDSVLVELRDEGLQRL